MLAFLFLTISLVLGIAIEHKLQFTKYLLGKFAFSFVTGTVLATSLCFFISWVIGFSTTAILLSLFLMIGIALKISGTDFSKIIRRLKTGKKVPVYVYFFIILFASFYIFGIFTGHSGELRFIGNFSDLAYHNAICNAFVVQPSFPPGNPQSSGFPLTYHFMVNFHSAVLAKGGLPCLTANLIVNSLLSVSLVLLVFTFLNTLFRSKKRVFWIMLLFFMAHTGLFNLIFYLLGQQLGALDPSAGIAGFERFKDVITYPYYNFLNINLNIFQPQRPFLIGFPIAMIFYQVFFQYSKIQQESHHKLVFLSLLVGVLPLFHFHTFLVIATTFFAGIFLISKKRFGTIPFFIIAGLLALPQVHYIITSPITNESFSFINFPQELLPFETTANSIFHRIYFWIRTTGPMIIVGWAGIIFVLYRPVKNYIEKRLIPRKRDAAWIISLLVSVFFLIVISVYQFTPNWGDNNKFFLYHLFFLSVTGGILVHRIVKKGGLTKSVTIILLVITTVFPYCFEYIVIWQKKIDYGIDKGSTDILFNPAEHKTAQWIRDNTSPTAVFLTSDNMVHFLPALTGRSVVDGAYTQETGIQKENIQQKTEFFFFTFRKDLFDTRIDYVLVSPKERSRYTVSSEENPLPEVFQLEDERWGIYTIYAYEETLLHEKSGDGMYLSDLVPSSLQEQYAHMRIDRGLEADYLELDGRIYEHGIAIHANAEITYRLDAQYESLTAIVGLDSANACKDGSIVLSIRTDGVVAYTSPTIRITSQPEEIAIDLSDITELHIQISDAEDGITCDHATIAEPILTPAKEKP